MVEYLDVVRGKRHFQCEKLRALLSTEACAAQWRKACSDVDSLSQCRLCPLGAEHAGDSTANLSPLRARLICQRCHRTSTRLICGSKCPSCYNRELEYIRGKNAKGTRPVKLRGMAAMRLRYVSCGVVHEARVERAVDPLELVVATLRDSTKQVRFGFCQTPPTLKQGRLW